MKVTPNPRYGAIAEIFRRHRKSLRPLQAVAFRAAEPQYAHVDKLIDGKGAYLHGSRWSAPRAFRCVNLSISAKIAHEESNAIALYYGWEEADLQPRVLVGLRLKLHKVLNLIAGTAVAKELDFADILAEDWREVNNGGSESLGQALGRAGHDIGAEGMVIPSVRTKGGTNIVVFPEAFCAQSRMEIVGREELERWIKKR